MYSLLIDTHDTKVLFVLYKDYKVLQVKEIDSKMRHSEIAMPTLISIIEENHINIKDIDNLLCIIGPGSFTGVRIGVVIAKTIAYLLNIPIIPITSLDLLVYSNKDILDGFYKVDEKNGYFVGRYDSSGNLLGEIKYYAKDELDSVLGNVSFNNVDNLDFTNILENALKKEPVNPHLVNPLYVKQIEALKWFLQLQN